MCHQSLEDIDDLSLDVVVEEVEVGDEFFLEGVRLQLRLAGKVHRLRIIIASQIQPPQPKMALIV